MTIFMRPLVLLASASFLTGAAFAERSYGSGGHDRHRDASRAEVYVDPDFRGRSLQIYEPVRDMSRLRFNDKISSIRLSGRWEICSDPDFRGRCRVLNNSDRRLSEIRMNDNISSMRPLYNRGGSRFGGWAGRSHFLAGTDVVFYPAPTGRRGNRVLSRRVSANDYCRRQGYRRAVYSNHSGRYLTDVLCRK